MLLDGVFYFNFLALSDILIWGLDRIALSTALILKANCNVKALILLCWTTEMKNKMHHIIVTNPNFFEYGDHVFDIFKSSPHEIQIFFVILLASSDKENKYTHFNLKRSTLTTIARFLI